MDAVSGELQGDTLVERFIDPDDEELDTSVSEQYDFFDNPDALPLDNLYQYRIRNSRRFNY